MDLPLTLMHSVFVSRSLKDKILMLTKYMLQLSIDNKDLTEYNTLLAQLEEVSKAETEKKTEYGHRTKTTTRNKRKTARPKSTNRLPYVATGGKFYTCEVCGIRKQESTCIKEVVDGQWYCWCLTCFPTDREHEIRGSKNFCLYEELMKEWRD
jgi:hypothetical protein